MSVTAVGRYPATLVSVEVARNGGSADTATDTAQRTYIFRYPQDAKVGAAPALVRTRANSLERRAYTRSCDITFKIGLSSLCKVDIDRE